METRQMTSCLPSPFSTLKVCNISEFENTVNLFSCGPLLGPLSINTSIFGQKLAIEEESRHSEVTKNLYYVLSIRRGQIPHFLGSNSWTYSTYVYT